MKIPTPEELQRADRAIRARGAMARETVELGVLVQRDPVLRAFIENIGRELGRMIENAPPGGRRGLIESLARGALMGGLNFALTVEEQRGAK
jgi:hypothetical protein